MDNTQNIWFKLFACCQIVKGKSCSLIYDLERGEFYDLANSYIDLLEMTETMDVASIKGNYDAQQAGFIDAFFDQFVQAEIGFFTVEPENFPKIDFTWHSPCFIGNAIIELSSLSDYDFSEVIRQLNALLCRTIQLRLLSPFSKADMLRIGKVFENTQVNSIEVLFPYADSLTKDDWDDVMTSQSRMRRVLIYAAPEDAVIVNEADRFGRKLIHFKKDIRIDDVEKIIPDRFIANIPMFAEAQNYNTGLNRKVCINQHGDIKNYINHNRSFGNVKTDKIDDIIGRCDFMEKWTVSNDKVEVCKDCQYRYGCVSNSDLRNEGDKWYKTTMCSFDVSTNTWAQVQ